MKLVTRDNLESWAGTTFSKAVLPYLISRLVRATTPSSTKVSIPSGSATYIGGWDGIVDCETDTSYVPQGTSLWEFGTSSDPKGKADEDYTKRKKNPIGFIPSNSIYIFVTPRLWTKKEDWVAEKKAENYWKDVKVYDSVDLEQWLDNTLSVARWFASQDGVSTYPFDGIMTADEFWEEWSIGPKLSLLPECLIAGREFEMHSLLTTLQGAPTIKAIKASTKNEAIAFIVACAKTFEFEESDRFFSKALLVDTEGNFRGLRINTNTPLNLIPRFDEAQPLYAAVSKGHHVLVPLGADDNFNQETIILPPIDRDGQIKSLIESGISEENAEKFSKESARNITILKKLLGFPHYKAKWVINENIREIIPALLVGRWNETYIGDIELIEQISEQKYSDYLHILNKWKNFEDAPIIQIGDTWRLTSPLDLWTNLISQLTPKDFKNIHECFLLAFKGGNPVIKPEDPNDFVAHFNKRKHYSSWTREGLTQSLILVARLNVVKISNLHNSQQWVDDIILDLLNDAPGKIWISIDHELPLISEASPESFLKAVTKSLSKQRPEVMDMFEEKDNFLHRTSNHTGLLWALENLAWLPEYLRDVTLILLKLSRLDPGGALSNRPSNSIAEIFKPWHYQTLASYDDRMQILRFVSKKEKDASWNLLLRMLPESHGLAHPTHKMRWRMFDKNTKLTYKYQEIYETHSEVIEILLDIFDNSEEKFAQLFEKLAGLSPNDRKRVLDWAEAIYPEINQKTFVIWETLRKILNHHRSHPNTDWSMPQADLIRLESIYNSLEPIDTINKYAWLFNDHWPKSPEGSVYVKGESDERYKQIQVKTDKARKDAVVVFLVELGLSQTLALRKEFRYSGIFGATLAKVIDQSEEVLKVCECLFDEKNLISFIHNFIYQKAIDKGFEWVKYLFNELNDKKKFTASALANVLIPLDQSINLWDFISTLDLEIQNEYWLNITAHFYKISDEGKIVGIKKLLEYKRFFSALDIVGDFSSVIPSDLLAEVLKKAVTEETMEVQRFDGYEIGEIFKEIEKRNDIERATIIHLEWLYLSILQSHSTEITPRTIEEELSKNPEFFIQVLEWIYIPENKELLEKERANISDHVVANIAKQAYQLLFSWKRLPGMKENYEIDENELSEWIKKVRELATQSSRLNMADQEIGKILAQYPENISLWPQEKIFKVIEEVNSDSLKRGYSSAMYNKTGFTSRGAYEGGTIERKKAEYFGKLAEDFRNIYPNVAEIFKNLQSGYLAEAKRMDDNAERDRLEY
ncbi:hypothetical protein LPB90_10550 [Chryseobacterium sp. LC2016-29]|uniref:hypothetical protein n=1 Tax=Chryseobacterium sp. LC2016-29 TaxID=2897331 RepID=UPI001E53E010|nr:hypothetical protein [Chryseobacterium sp. LC2016-29]MCD0478899.1 hypothetical protein [Chryseobacterium sp. LC2016-29]